MAAAALLTPAAERVTGVLGGAGVPTSSSPAHAGAVAGRAHPTACFGIAFHAMICSARVCTGEQARRRDLVARRRSTRRWRPRPRARGGAHARRVRQGREPLDVDAEAARRLRELGGGGA
jgi:hypothetical protein